MAYDSMRHTRLTNEQIYQIREDNPKTSYRKIGKSIGLSGARIEQIYKKIKNEKAAEQLLLDLVERKNTNHPPV